MTTKRAKAAKGDAQKEPATKEVLVEDGETAERMRQATKPGGGVKNKPHKTRTLDDVIELLHNHGIRFKDEE